MLKFSGVASSCKWEECWLCPLEPADDVGLLPGFPWCALYGVPALIGESDLLKSREEFPTESPDLLLGLACFLLGPEPLIPLFGGLSLENDIRAQ